MSEFSAISENAFATPLAWCLVFQVSPRNVAAVVLECARLGGTVPAEAVAAAIDLLRNIELNYARLAGVAVVAAGVFPQNGQGPAAEASQVAWILGVARYSAYLQREGLLPAETANQLLDTTTCLRVMQLPILLPVASEAGAPSIAISLTTFFSQIEMGQLELPSSDPGLISRVDDVANLSFTDSQGFLLNRTDLPGRQTVLGARHPRYPALSADQIRLIELRQVLGLSTLV